MIRFAWVMLHRFWMKYIAATAAYGIVRTVPRVWGKEKDYLNSTTKKYEKKPMLTTEKIGECVLSAATGPTLWPIFAYTDICLLEISLRSQNPAEYGLE